MANINETEQWEDGIYQLETTDPVEGGADGVDNTPHKHLANRTKWLKAQIEAVQNTISNFSFAALAGSATQKFKVAAAVANDEAVNKAQMDSAVSEIGGKTLQVKKTLLKTSSVQTTSGANHVPITDLNVDITPKSNTSYIKIEARWCGEYYLGHDAMFGVSKNGVQINSANKTGANEPNGIAPIAISYHTEDTESTLDSCFLSTIDTPNTTNPLNYAMTLLTEATQTLYNGRCKTQSAGTPIGSLEIIATEIEV